MLKKMLFLFAVSSFFMLSSQATAESEGEIIYSKKKQVIAHLGSPEFKLKSNKKIANIRVTKDPSLKKGSVVIIENPGTYKITYQLNVRNPNKVPTKIYITFGTGRGHHNLQSLLYGNRVKLDPGEIIEGTTYSFEFKFEKNDIVQIVNIRQYGIDLFDKLPLELLPVSKNGNAFELKFERIGDL